MLSEPVNVRYCEQRTWFSCLVKCTNNTGCCLVLQGSGDEEDLDDDDSLSEDTGSEMQDELMDDSEYSEKKSQPPTPSPSPPETPRPSRKRRKARSPSCSDDENRPPSPKVLFSKPT